MVFSNSQRAFENHTNKPYQERMNSTASSKLSIAKHLGENVKLVLDLVLVSRQNSSNKWRKPHYVAYDVSQIVQSRLQENNTYFVTKEQLESAEMN